MKKTLFFLAVLLTGFVVEAKTVLISDVDDTLKQSHILNRTEAVTNAMITDNPFLGMNGVLAALQIDQPELKIFYVTNAIESLMRTSHTRFLAENQFPAGTLFLRRSVFDQTYKVTAFRQILKSEKPDSVILLGDNGERDVEVFEKIHQEFPAIQFHSFVHTVYSVKNHEETGARILPGQKGFATSFDLLVQFLESGFVKAETTTQFFSVYSTAFLQESTMQSQGPLAIPLWMDCGDLKLVRAGSEGTEILFQAVREKIVKRCGLEGRDGKEKRELF
jgi:hypothetical protein